MMHQGNDDDGDAGGEATMSAPRTFADLQEENDALRAEVESLKSQMVEMDLKHTKELNKLLYRLVEVSKGNEALSETSDSINVDKEVDRLAAEGGAVGGEAETAKAGRGKEGNKAPDVSETKQSAAEKKSAAAAAPSEILSVKAASPARSTRTAVQKLAAAESAATLKVSQATQPVIKINPGARRAQESRMLKELKTLGALDETATDLRSSLDLSRLVGLGMWKWFPAEPSEAGTTGTRLKVLQFLGVFGKLDTRSRPQRIQVDYNKQQPSEWWTVDELVDEYNATTVRGIKMFYAKDKVQAFLEKAGGGGDSSSFAAASKPKAASSAASAVASSNQKDEATDTGAESGKKMKKKIAVEEDVVLSTNKNTSSVEASTGGRRKKRERPASALAGEAAAAAATTTTSSTRSTSSGNDSVASGREKRSKAAVAAEPSEVVAAPVEKKRHRKKELEEAKVSSPDEMEKKPVVNPNAERDVLRELVALQVLPKDAAPIHLRELDLEALKGYGLSEYWLVPHAGQLKEKLYHARFTDKIAKAVNPRTGKRVKVIEALYTDRSTQTFDIKKLVDAFTGEPGMVAKQGIVGFLSKEKVGEIFSKTNFAKKGKRKSVTQVSLTPNASSPPPLFMPLKEALPSGAASPSSAAKKHRSSTSKPSSSSSSSAAPAATDAAGGQEEEGNSNLAMSMMPAISNSKPVAPKPVQKAPLLFPVSIAPSSKPAAATKPAATAAVPPPSSSSSSSTSSSQAQPPSKPAVVAAIPKPVVVTPALAAPSSSVSSAVVNPPHLPPPPPPAPQPPMATAAPSVHPPAPPVPPRPAAAPTSFSLGMGMNSVYPAPPASASQPHQPFKPTNPLPQTGGLGALATLAAASSSSSCSLPPPTTTTTSFFTPANPPQRVPSPSPSDYQAPPPSFASSLDGALHLPGRSS